MVENEAGAILNFMTDDEKKECLGLYQRKMRKAFGREDILQCLPIMWQELHGIKSRVDDILK
jgi:hypothetical protein